jgi:MoaA/NifB/PqqE/SkfB family radical SAM enzyme
VVRGRAFFALYAPGFPSHAFDRFALSEIARARARGPAPSVQTAIFAITTRCGLSCEHCFEWNDLGSREALSAEALHAIVDQIVAAGTSQLFLSGGEPLLRFDDLHSLVRRFSNDADIWVLTAGGALTETRARSLSEAGLTGVCLSLDHWDPAEHDAFRGKEGTFEAARSAARAALDAGLLLTLSLCPTRRFVNEANLRAYRDLAREWGASFIQLLEPRAVGRYASQGVELDDSQRALLERWHDEDNFRQTTGPSIAYVDYVERATSCPAAGQRVAYVDTRGTLHACPFCREGDACLTTTSFPEALDALRQRGCGRQRQPALTV